MPVDALPLVIRHGPVFGVSRTAVRVCYRELRTTGTRYRLEDDQLHFDIVHRDVLQLAVACGVPRPTRSLLSGRITLRSVANSPAASVSKCWCMTVIRWACSTRTGGRDPRRTTGRPRSGPGSATCEFGWRRWLSSGSPRAIRRPDEPACRAFEAFAPAADRRQWRVVARGAIRTAGTVVADQRRRGAFAGPASYGELS